MKISGNLYINNTYRRTYKWASQPPGLDVIVGVLSGWGAKAGRGAKAGMGFLDSVGTIWATTRGAALR